VAHQRDTERERDQSDRDTEHDQAVEPAHQRATTDRNDRVGGMAL
jgi:hypothetical protein